MPHAVPIKQQRQISRDPQRLEGLDSIQKPEQSTMAIPKAACHTCETIMGVKLLASHVKPPKPSALLVYDASCPGCHVSLTKHAHER